MSYNSKHIPERDGSIDGQVQVAPITCHRFVVILEADAAAPRKDTDGILKALSKREGSRISPIVYRWSRGDVAANFAASLKLHPLAQWCVLVRVNPESLLNHPNFNEAEFWNFVQELNEQYSTTIISDPNVMVKIADKQVLVNIRNETWYGLGDTEFYSSREELVKGLHDHASTATATNGTAVERVLKRNRGRSGESVIKLTFTSLHISCNELDKPDEPPRHYQSVDELMSRDATKLFSFENGIGWIDMRFLPHITDGEVRLIMDGDECVSVMQRPNRGALCAKAGSPWLSVRISNNVKNPAKAGAKQGDSACSEVEAQRLRMAFLDSLPTLKGILQIENAVLPPLWTADFIRNDLTDGDDAVPWSLCEFNAMSTGYTAFGSADNPRTMQEFGNAMARSIERRFEIHAANKDESKVDVGIN